MSQMNEIGTSGHDGGAKAGRRSSLWRFLLLGLVPAFFAVMAVLCYVFGGIRRGVLTGAVASAGVPAFIASLGYAGFEIIQLFKGGRIVRALLGIGMYLASMASALIGFLAVLARMD